MRTAIRKIGNSQGVLIPKPLLAEAGLEAQVDMVVENGALILRPARASQPRAGWAEAARALAEAGDDALLWPEFANAEDAEFEW
ncbi:MAG: AbrB/MazE/SpoVT family DNA-binding domain-containing protein [Betaproteobacteria bacterium]|nr:AbrB/MazE/SpoVT family DNA-binding domain-containing protein [Betaproteobacteria bacterium]